MSAPPPADDAPPPAYSEEELDTKISQAIEESLRLDAKGAPHDNAADEWEEWDEALFEANSREAQSPGAGSSSAASPSSAYEETFSSASTAAVSPPMSTASGSSSGSSSVGRMPTVRPLRLHRPSPSVTSSGGAEKPRPSWYAEAGLGRPSDSSESSRNPLPVPPPPPLPAELRQPQTPPTDDDAPPAFTPVGPSLDGPAYEEVVHLEYHVPESQASSPLTSPVILPQDSSVRLSYEGPQDLGHEDDSEEDTDNMPAPPPPPLPRVRGPRAAPAPPRSRFSDPVPQALVGIPRVQFNPSLAYKREETVGAMEQAAAPAPPPKGDAMAFYNSAVSSVLKPRTAPHVPASVNNRYSMLPPGAAAPTHPHHLSLGYGDHPSQSAPQSWYNPVPVHAPVASYPPSAPQFYQHR